LITFRVKRAQCHSCSILLFYKYLLLLTTAVKISVSIARRLRV
jgi:hypothetical protein